MLFSKEHLTEYYDWCDMYWVFVVKGDLMKFLLVPGETLRQPVKDRELAACIQGK